MRALFVSPLPFTGVSGTAMAGSVDNLNLDLPGLIFRGGVAASIVVDLGPDPVAYDTVAIIGTNLRSGDAVRVRTGTDPNTNNGYDSAALPAWTGTKPRQLTAKSIIKLSGTRTERYVKVTFNASGNPNGYVQAQRLVIGKAVSTLGIKFGAKMNFEDRSLITTAPGFMSADRYDVLIGWDITTTNISDASWRTEWAPMLLEAGSSAGILFVRDEHEPASWHTDAIFGRITSKAAGEALGYDFWTFAGTILSFAP